MNVPWSLEEYEDPLLYDIENDGTPELPFLQKWAALSGIGRRPVLDLACGTGRLTLPMSDAGYAMVGIDIHEGMLKRAMQKAGPGSTVAWLCQDCRDLNLDLKSPFAFMTGHAFQHFLTNEHQAELLQSVRRVLCPDGLFIFNTRFPSATELLQPAEEQVERSMIDHLNRTVETSYKMVYDPVKQIQHYTTIRRFYRDRELLEEKVTTIDLRYTYPQEIGKTLSLHGFELLHCFDGWEEKPLHPDCYSMVVVCRKDGE